MAPQNVAAPSYGANVANAAAQGAAATPDNVAAPSYGANAGNAAAQEDIMNYRKHIRLPNYDYSQNGYYFVTICTHMRRPIFVDAVKSLVEQKINQIHKYYKGVDIDYNEVMPTHVHIILILNDTNTSLPKIINAFKSWVTRDIKRNVAAPSYGANAIWQPNYYEHVIRNESALNKIREYIINNPDKEEYDWGKLDV